jgi:hypothetical protein
MTDHHESQHSRAAARGLRPSTAKACPRVVAGKRCGAGLAGACVCQTYRRVLDHGRIWLDQDGRHLLTGEPYDLSPRSVAEFTAAMTELGLSVSLSGRSMWNPGQCLLVTVRRAS